MATPKQFLLHRHGDHETTLCKREHDLLLTMSSSVDSSSPLICLYLSYNQIRCHNLFPISKLIYLYNVGGGVFAKERIFLHN